MRSGKLLTYTQVKRMTSGELEVLWDLDFETLVTTAIVEADRVAHRAVSDTLRSQRWAPRWRDALQACEAELRVSVERMEYRRDPRLGATLRRLQRVRFALMEARTLIKHWKKHEGLQNPVHIRMGKASETAKAWLVKHHLEEWREYQKDECRAAGLTDHSPVHGVPNAEDGLDSYVILIENGHVDLPLSPYGDKLFDMDDTEFRNVVADDVRAQNTRITELRHPLLMNDWMAALQTLEEMTRERAQAQPDGSRNLISLDRNKLRSLPHDEAMALLNARRFYQGVTVRMAEWDYLSVQYGRTAAARFEEIKRPWFEAGRRAGFKICKAHPDEYAAILAALAPFLIEGSTDTLDRNRFHNGERLRLKRLTLAALADNTWRTLPQQAASAA